MPASGAPLVGAVLGVGIQLYVNAVRKLPLGRTPWMHVLWAGAGASFGAWLVDFEDRTQKDLEGGWPQLAYHRGGGGALREGWDGPSEAQAGRRGGGGAGDVRPSRRALSHRALPRSLLLRASNLRSLLPQRC